MKIFVTNLEWSVERREFMEKQLAKLGLGYEIVKCVVGKDLSPDEIALHCDIEAINNHNKVNKWFNEGIIGCTITNQNVYRKMVDEDIKVAMYLEDDMTLPDNLPAILKTIEETIKPGDVFLLYWAAFNKIQLQATGTMMSGIKVYEPKDPKSIVSGSAFVVTRDAAEKMLYHNTPIKITPDCWSYFLEVNAIKRLFCLYPRPVRAADFQSTMELGKFVRLRKFINKYKIFPFYQMLSLYRRNVKENMSQVEIIS